MATVDDKNILVDATSEPISLRLIGRIGEDLAESLVSYLSTVGVERALAIDLSRCDQIHRKALAVLVTHALQMKKTGKKMQLFNPMPTVSKMLSDFQIPQLMEVQSAYVPMETANLRAVLPPDLEPNELRLNTSLAEENLELLRKTPNADLSQMAEHAVVPPAWRRGNTVQKAPSPSRISKDKGRNKDNLTPTELTMDILRAIFVVCIVSALYGITMLIGTRLGFVIFYGSSMIAYETFIVYRAINKAK
jgi:ABC-type transporter Mla MlaB component